jgi:hypothetical protein
LHLSLGEEVNEDEDEDEEEEEEEDLRADFQDPLPDSFLRWDSHRRDEITKPQCVNVRTQKFDSSGEESNAVVAQGDAELGSCDVFMGIIARAHRLL